MAYLQRKTRAGERVAAVLVLAGLFANLGGHFDGTFTARADEAEETEIGGMQDPVGVGSDRRCEIVADGEGTLLKCRGGPPELVAPKPKPPASTGLVGEPVPAVANDDDAEEEDRDTRDGSGALPITLGEDDAPTGAKSEDDDQGDADIDEEDETSSTDDTGQPKGEPSTEPSGPVLTREEELRLILRGWE